MAPLWSRGGVWVCDPLCYQTGEKDGQSFGGGRYRYAQVLPGDKVALDFNQARDSLCAYSSYFHCPIPPRRNWLSRAIPVGEKRYHPDDSHGR